MAANSGSSDRTLAWATPLPFERGSASVGRLGSHDRRDQANSDGAVEASSDTSYVPSLYSVMPTAVTSIVQSSPRALPLRASSFSPGPTTLWSPQGSIEMPTSRPLVLWTVIDVLGGSGNDYALQTRHPQ